MVLTIALFLIGYAGFASAQADGSNIIDALSSEADAGFARALAPMDFQFPRDHGPHPEYKIEWWYYTGNLKSDDGKDLGYQLTFFRSAMTPDMPERASNFAANQRYMAHFALTDVSAKRYASFERHSRGAGGLAGATGEPTYEVWLEDWSAKTIAPGVMRLQAFDDRRNPQVGIDLTLKETRPPVLHGDRGFSQKGPEPGNANYYYSLVGLETAGTATSGGKPIAVSGVSWMDHEFGTSALSGGAEGWDWFGLQLNNGMALALGRIRHREGEGSGYFDGGTLAYRDGRQMHIAPGDFTLTAVGKWASSKTGVVYPAGWRITLPKLNIDLAVQPLLKDQELRGSFVYWEGAASVQGTIDGKPVSGYGYVELTGYGTSNHQLSRRISAR
jgi:predicted secreted hydrolase